MINSKEPQDFLKSFYTDHGVSEDREERYRKLKQLVVIPSLDREPTFAELELEVLRNNGFDYL
jgi:hypothetical protein